MTERQPDGQLLMYRKGFIDALSTVEAMAGEDRRVSLARDCGYVPSWQKALWDFAKRVGKLRAARENAMNGDGECAPTSKEG